MNAVAEQKPPFRLLEHWQTNLKFEGRAPRTLYELGVANEELRHRGRMAELKSMGPKLDQLDAFLPALAERGTKLALRDIHSCVDRKKLVFYCVLGRDDRMYRELLSLGFKEVERGKGCTSTENWVTLKHGRNLLLRLTVSPLAETKADPVAAVEGGGT